MNHAAFPGWRSDQNGSFDGLGKNKKGIDHE
jgi:hypothetical protein